MMATGSSRLTSRVLCQISCRIDVSSACDRKTSEGMNAKDIGREQGDVLVVAAKSFAVVRTPRKSVGLTHRLPWFMMEGKVEPREEE